MKFTSIDARFPEDLWQIQQKTDRARFNNQVRRGYESMSSLSISVVGLARNISVPLSFNLKRLEALRSCVNLNWTIYTNDNEDNTLDVLESFKTENDIIIHETLNNKFHGSVECGDRYRDMAYYRNKYIGYIKHDYTLVIDLDIDGFSYDGLAQSIFFMETMDIDCIGANSLLYREKDGKVQRLFYDTLAFRRLDAPHNTPHDGRELNLMSYNRGEDLVHVQSCFGGIALYRTSAIKGMKYLHDDCDHVTINRRLDNVYLNPSLIVLFGDNPYTL
jgi:hypothetical protein